MSDMAKEKARGHTWQEGAQWHGPQNITRTWGRWQGNTVLYDSVLRK